MKPSESTRQLYDGLPHDQHEFVNRFHEWDVDCDEMRMEADDFPYFRNALIAKAVIEGDIEQYD